MAGAVGCGPLCVGGKRPGTDDDAAAILDALRDLLVEDWVGEVERDVHNDNYAPTLSMMLPLCAHGCWEAAAKMLRSMTSRISSTASSPPLSVSVLESVLGM